MLLEKCKFLAHRNLFKRVWICSRKSSQIPLRDIQKALALCHVKADLDEVECILANLIYRSYIRGYLSHGKRMLVLSKKDPFPTAAVVK